MAVLICIVAYLFLWHYSNLYAKSPEKLHKDSLQVKFTEMLKVIDVDEKRYDCADRCLKIDSLKSYMNQWSKDIDSIDRIQRELYPPEPHEPVKEPPPKPLNCNCP